MKLSGRLAFILFGVVVWFEISSTAASAAGVVGTGSPTSCDSNDLAAAIQGGGLVTFNCGSDPHVITSNTYVIEDDTTIRGANLITLDGENLRQHFIVQDGVSLTLEEIVLLEGESGFGGCIAVGTNATLTTKGVTFRGCRDVSMTLGGGAVYNLGTFRAVDTLFETNHANASGGALFNRGIFNATRVVFEANTAGDDSGAIINVTDGVVSISDSAFVGNSSAMGGGAISNLLSSPQTNGSLTIRRTLFVDNSSSSFGGAIHNITGGMTIENSTFVRNISNQGGAIFSENTATTTIRFSTFSGNRADTGGAIYRPLTGQVELGYSILAGSRNEANTADQLECDGPALISLGFNLIEDNSCVSGSNASDIRNTPPQIGELANNGGFSLSILPNANSPALNKVPAVQCPDHDQRLAKRRGPCDIGAVERDGLFVSAYIVRIQR